MAFVAAAANDNNNASKSRSVLGCLCLYVGPEELGTCAGCSLTLKDAIKNSSQQTAAPGMERSLLKRKQVFISGHLFV